MTDISGLDALDAEVVALEQSLGGAEAVARAFDTELRRMRGTLAATGTEVGTLSRGISRGLRRAFEGLVFDGTKLSDALGGVARSMVDAAYSAAIKPVSQHFGGMIASGVAGLIDGAFADGAAFTQGRVMPFAKGGVVAGPTTFPMRGGTGLMGEAGPEAIMPLARAPDGRLGVRAEGSVSPVQVVMNISTPDVEGFRRSGTQVAAQMSRALARGARNR
ncbi:phage tail tape measure protein [Mesobaculum littorinae]|uniref:Phage tail tape measure protein n=1 Tax=Mesobaculum littorinae TaxID=2486419 RepID=A0A438AJP0_9RHOB|nr:phage tail tape measure protein [Mesobaculum littorinae]RVV99003.1 phage tail tape measure protein [Mesobaculum littorinae]